MRAATRLMVIASASMLALSGCSAGGDATPVPTSNDIAALTGPQILDKARATAKTEGSLHIKGTGSCTQLGVFGVDMKLRAEGTGTGTVTTSAGKINVVTAPGTVYLQGPSTFWTSQISAKAATQIGDRWVKLPARGNECIVALGTFSDVLANYLDIPGTPVKENSTSILGVPAQLITIPPDLGVWVSTTGQALPLYLSSPSGGLKLALGEWGRDVTVTMPAGADVLPSTSIVSK